jgi:hypothetical protein
VLPRNNRFVIAMAVGSVVGSFIGALGIVPEAILLPTLALICWWRQRSFGFIAEHKQAALPQTDPTDGV